MAIRVSRWWSEAERKGREPDGCGLGSKQGSKEVEEVPQGHISSSYATNPKITGRWQARP